MADEPLFMAIRASDPAFQQSVRDAQRTLPEFRRLLQSEGVEEWHPCVKTRVTAGDERAFLWLLVVRLSPTGFVTSVFEVPAEFEGIAVGDEIEVVSDAVMDWMVNKAGVLHGGYSLRYQRSLLPPEKWAWYDEYIGVTEYAQ